MAIMQETTAIYKTPSCGYSSLPFRFIYLHDCIESLHSSYNLISILVCILFLELLFFDRCNWQNLYYLFNFEGQENVYTLHA